VAPQPEVRIGERLRFYRQAKGKTQAVVAGLAGVTEDYLNTMSEFIRSATRYNVRSCHMPGRRMSLT